MNKKINKNLLLMFLCVIVILGFRSSTVQAAMADEAEDYELGENYTGKMTSSAMSTESRYYRIQIMEKSHVTLYAAMDKEPYYSCDMDIYNAAGKIVVKNNDISYKQNAVTGLYKGQQSRTLPKGIYYLKVEGNKAVIYTFRIEAEKQIKLPKGTLKSLKSAKKGHMTVKCASAKNAIGYRIQYSTDYKFKKGVKTVYSATTTKTIKGLKKGKRYYVKVCPYTVYDDGTRVFGQNSYVKTVVVKKK